MCVIVKGGLFLIGRSALAVLLAAVLLIPVQLLSGETIPYPPEIARIKKRGKLIVAQYGGQRPGFFAYDDEKKTPAPSAYSYQGRRLVGFDVDLAKLIARALEVDLEIRREFETFNSVAVGVACGHADIAISKLSVTTGRAQFLQYCTPYISLRTGVVINRVQESRLVGEVNDEAPFAACHVKGAKVGVLDKSSFVEHGHNYFPKAEIRPFPTQDALFRAVMVGEVDAVLYEEYEISKYMRRFSDMPIYCRAVYYPNKVDYIAMAVPGTSSALREFINLFMRKEGIRVSVADLQQRYLPEGELDQTRDVVELDLSAPALYISFLSALGLLLFWFFLARRPRSQTGSPTQESTA